jgi:MOSC domain-containing protein YiiM
MNAPHRSLVELESGLQMLPRLSGHTGRLVLIARRHADGSREAPQSVQLTPETGIPGEKWGRQRKRNPEQQLAVMRRDVAELIANGQPLTAFGDNLFVDLDISAANLPAGTRLRVGDAVVEVTAYPHNGCETFKKRFGIDAFRFVNAPPTRDQNLRGVYWKVIEAGEVNVGAAIEVTYRPPMSE